MQPDLFTEEPEPGFCHVCEIWRVAPKVCGPSCIADMYPRKDTDNG